MTRRKKKKNVKRYAIIATTALSIAIITIVAVFIVNKNNRPVVYTRNKDYVKGTIYSVNASANLLDDIYEGENILISPINANIALATIYNGTDNKSEKEIIKYFKDDQITTNKKLANKLNNLKETNNVSKKANYEKYINLLFAKNFDNLKTQDLNRLTQKEKDELLLTLRKIELYYNQSTTKMKDKEIEKYKLTDKERASSSYVIKEKIDSILVQYEIYSINNNVNNYNELYYNGKTKIDKKFLTNITDTINTKITSIDYKTDINETINTNLPNNSIKIDKDKLTTKDLVSINTLYFNSEWESNFKNEYTVAEEFTDYNDKHYLVDMMYSEEKYYIENNEASGFIKNFEGNKYSFVGILPKDNKDLLLGNINLEALLDTKKETKVNVGLPKFSIDSTNDLIDLYQKENITEIFTARANLHLMTDKELKVGMMLQKETLTIGELGTVESKVKTATLSTKITENETKQITLNRPFAFLIIENETNEVLLIGRFNKPDQK